MKTKGGDTTKILVLDDRRDVLDEVVPALSGLFEISGFQVTSVKEALAVIENTQSDAILLDIQLGSGGYEGVEIALELQNRGYTGIVIGHSSFSLLEQKKLLSPYGVKHFARKGSVSILRCLAGTCTCHEPEKAKSQKAQEGIGVLAGLLAR